MNSIYITGLLCCLFILTGAATSSFSLPDYYTVKEGDTLAKIARMYGGTTATWQAIYKANKQKIDNPDLIFPGQKLEIPTQVALMKEARSTDELSADENKPQSDSSSTATEKAMMEKFRAAFKDVVKQEKKETTEPAEETASEDYEGLSLGGMILDETRSKMGRDFYSIFYQQWEEPGNKEYFTIKIREQPIPSRGTIVIIEIDNQVVFKQRLGPRFDETEKTAKQAVKVCQWRLQQQMSMQDEFLGY